MTSQGPSGDDEGAASVIDVQRLVGRASRAVTHRLVNDLAALRLQAEAAGRIADQGALAVRLAGVTEGAAVAVSLVRELHRLGDLATGTRPVDLGQFARELAPLLTAMAGTRGDVVVELPAAAVVCDADPADLRRHVVAAFLDRPPASSSDGQPVPTMLTVLAGEPSLVLRDGDTIVYEWPPRRSAEP